MLLTAACADESAESLARLSIGRRDERLLALRAGTFGAQFNSLADCPSCGERLELNFNLEDFGTESAELPENLALAVAEYSVRFRLPNTLDLATLETAGDVAAHRRHLLARCLVGARRGDQEVSAADLPEAVTAAIAERMAQADPKADLQLALTCPCCRHHWQAAFDIVSFLWKEIHAWAIRLLRDVHELASAYGWRESDILALGSWRRQAYLEMIRS